MIRYLLKFNNSKGFSMVEIIISIAILSIITVAVVSFFLSMDTANSVTTSGRDASENAQRAMDEITYEIRSAKSIYAPTTTANQLSLETLKYLPSGENDSFVDFFLCGNAICLRKDSQDPVAITSDTVQVTGLTFFQVTTGTSSSVQVSLTVSSGTGSNLSTSSLTSTAVLRTY